MDKELITKNEVENDEKSIHLYFDEEVGMYVAFGFSAFFVTHFVDVVCSFSEVLSMPVALLKRSDVEELRLSVSRIKHDYHKYYLLQLKKPMSLEGYVRWGNSVKWASANREEVK